MRQRVVSVGLIGAFAFSLLLAASPQLHEFFHPDANQPGHECAVTLIVAGSYDHTVTPPVVIAAPAPITFSDTLSGLEASALPSLFLSARIFEHAPPVSA